MEEPSATASHLSRDAKVRYPSCMNVTERVRADLARTLARHFPEWDRRERLVTAAGLPDAQLAGDAEGSWRCIVDQALDEGRLPQLLATAARSKPDDAELRALSERAARGELTHVARTSQLPLVALGAATVVLGVVVLGLGARAVFWAPMPPPPAAVSVAPPPPAPAAPPKPRPVAMKVPVAPPGATILVTPIEPDPAPVADARPPEPVGATTTAEPASASPSVAAEPPAASGPVVKLSSGACAGAAIRDGRIGYAFAGSEAPVVRDATWRPASSVNVRIDYPDEHNGFDARATVVCAAPKGALVELAGEAIAVPGGAFWLPVADVRSP